MKRKLYPSSLLVVFFSILLSSSALGQDVYIHTYSYDENGNRTSRVVTLDNSSGTNSTTPEYGRGANLRC